MNDDDMQFCIMTNEQLTWALLHGLADTLMLVADAGIILLAGAAAVSSLVRCCVRRYRYQSPSEIILGDRTFLSWLGGGVLGPKRGVKSDPFWQCGREGYTIKQSDILFPRGLVMEGRSIPFPRGKSEKNHFLRVYARCLSDAGLPARFLKETNEIEVDFEKTLTLTDRARDPIKERFRHLLAERLGVEPKAAASAQSPAPAAVVLPVVRVVPARSVVVPIEEPELPAPPRRRSERIVPTTAQVLAMQRERRERRGPTRAQRVHQRRLDREADQAESAQDGGAGVGGGGPARNPRQ